MVLPTKGAVDVEKSLQISVVDAVGEILINAKDVFCVVREFLKTDLALIAKGELEEYIMVSQCNRTSELTRHLDGYAGYCRCQECRNKR